uniref:ubiquitinyl hydrolase 1 n=1 Tax=Octactis speculum TaxID=3111310 RepID=A0A7S2FKD8_9STRA
MNSTLQCLSNCPPLADFFSSGQFAAEINRDNPLGHDGKLAESFGSLMKLMWPAEGEGTISCVAPRAFKYQMGTFRPEFSGYQQHDSSELMNFLLDGLHEDLNRIHQKPYTESVDSDGRPDPVVAKESLDRYKLRNDSKIQDLFLGQFKSTLVCPDCGNVSITFDPYTMISLPLRTAQEEMQQQYRVTFVQVKRGSDGKRHHQVLKLGIPKGANAGKLREALSEAVNVPEERLVIGQMMRSYIYKFFDDSASLDFVKAGTSTLLAYEVEHADAFIYEEKSYNNYYGRSSAQVSKAPAHNEAAIIMYFRKEEQSQYTSTSYYSRSYTHTVLYGEPLLFNHPRNTSPANLYEAIADVLGPDVKSDMFKMYVCDTYGKADRDCVDHLDTNDVNNGMKQKLYIVIEWIDKGGGGGGGGDAMDEDATSDTDQADDAEAEDESLTLERCLELFSSPEKLTKEDAWYCDKCKNHVEATKSMQLWTTPEILVCHLKRFSYSRYYRDKVETPVQFPLENLDLSRFVLSPDIPGLSNMYDLVAVSNHMGSLGCGHYTASGRSCVDGQWYKFNDSSTSRMSPEAVNTGDVYFLFYVRKDSPQNPRNRPT